MRFVVLGALLALCACAPSAPPESRAEIIARAQSAAPADARLAGLYQNACKNCHINPDSGAPLALDRGAWDERWRKGEDTLLAHTLSGFNGMPAGGQCFACSADDHRVLIAFMAGREESREE